ncbi:MAG: cyclic nucleotide-binding domain-containing protein [Ghiorsea sp.]
MEYSEKETMMESMIESNVDYKTMLSLPLIAELADKDTMVLFSCMTKAVYEENEIICNAGDESMGKMRLILDGKVTIKNGGGYKYGSLRAGDVFGLFSFLDESRKHSATLTVELKTTVLTIERSYFDLITLEDPKLGHKLMRFMFVLLSKKASELEGEYANMHNFAFGGKV